MTDGVHTLTQFSSQPFFYVGKGPSGQIVVWDIDEVSSSAEPNVFLATGKNSFFTTQDSTNTFGLVASDFGFASNLNNPGTWTSSAVPTVPEPSNLFLLGTGVLYLQWACAGSRLWRVAHTRSCELLDAYAAPHPCDSERALKFLLLLNSERTAYLH